MLSSIAITLLPLILMLSGCGSPELLAPALSEMPGISKSQSQASPSRESQGQETAQSQESRQLLATSTNPIPQSECSYQCSKLGFHNGGKCSNSYCRCLVEHREAKTLWNGWVSEGICSSITLEGLNAMACGDPADPYKCDFPSQRQSHYQDGTCGPPGFVSGSAAYNTRRPQEWGYIGDRGYGGDYNGKSFFKLDVCGLWAKSFSVEENRIEKLKLGKDDTPVCVRFAEISYACSA